MYFKSVFTRGEESAYIFYIFESREISWTELLIPQDLEFQYLRGILSLFAGVLLLLLIFFTAPFYVKAAKKSVVDFHMCTKALYHIAKIKRSKLYIYIRGCRNVENN